MTSRRMDRRVESAGFTLVELLIVIVIVAILVAVAVPIYTQQVQQSRRTEATNAVLELASREEKYFSINNSYSTEPDQLGYSADATTFPQSTGTYYQITVTTPDPAQVAAGQTGPTYIITATPAAGSPQLNDSQCQSFSVIQTGVQTAYNSAGTSNPACWQ
jgi:type IV pilus assembly protein PilE